MDVLKQNRSWVCFDSADEAAKSYRANFEGAVGAQQMTPYWIGLDEYPAPQYPRSQCRRFDGDGGHPNAPLNRTARAGNVTWRSANSDDAVMAIAGGLCSALAGNTLTATGATGSIRLAPSGDWANATVALVRVAPSAQTATGFDFVAVC